MAIKIRTRGASTSEAKPKAKPAKSRPAKRGAKAKPAAKAPAKRGPGRPRKQAGEEAPAKPRRYSTGVDPKQEAKALKLVEKAGDRRRKAEEEHKEAVSALHEAALEALNIGVSMAKVADASGISRQWLYKMGEYADRGAPLRAGNGSGNGNGGGRSKAKPKPRAKAKPAKRSAGRTRSQTQAPSKRSPRRRVSIRSS